MSFLKLSQNIVRLRKERKITQEELAEFAGVTKGSVSKWETETTTPDIQILPVLAAFFDVSVDELLGYEAQLGAKQIKYYYHNLAHDFAEKEFDQVWEECNQLTKKYYGCYSFLMQMALLYLNHSTLAKTESQKEQVLLQAEKLCTRVVDQSEDTGLCEKASAIRAIIWLQQGKPEQIIDSMEKEVLDVNRTGDKAAILPLAYLASGNVSMAEKSSQIGLYRHLMELLGNSQYLLMSTQKGADYCYQIMKRTDQIMKTYEMETLIPNSVAVYEYQAALKLCQLGASEAEIYERIENYVRAVCRLYQDGIKVHADSFFYLLEDWFQDLELGVDGVRDSRVILSDSIASLKHPAFAILKDQKRMSRCVEKMEALLPGCL